MEIIKLILGACETNCYLVCSEKKNAILIDAADEPERIISAIEENGLTLKYIFITHGHTDHVLALKKLKNYYGVPVIISGIDAWRLEDEELINERPYVTVPYEAVSADLLISEGDEIRLDELRFRFYGMPGHTDGSLAVICGDIIFTGDTLLKGNHGKTTLPGGDEEKLICSIRRMASELDGDYRILPGHRQETTLEEERRSNPYIR